MMADSQKEKLEIIERWLEEIAQSAEFQKLEYYLNLTLGDALQAVRELLNLINLQN